MKYWWTLLLLFCSLPLIANTGAPESIVERMPNLVMQLGIIIFTARLGASLVEKIGIPGVLGELLIGVLIGPYLLGSVPIPGFPHGLFAGADSTLPIQPELYGIAIIASIILLFLSGLETDINLFIKFSFAGTVIGIGGIVFSFLFGALTAKYFLHLPLADPKCMFLGIMSTATSVGITARILSERKKMDTPEGVTIIAGAVIDDVLGVILLAIVLGISVHMKTGGEAALNWGKIGMIAFKEIGIWLGVTVIGLYFAKRIGGFLKIFKDRFVFSVLAFSLALVIAGLFERAGLAMIIGAYVVGLTLSKTDISFAIQEALHPLRIFFVPVFFTVMGMLVDVKSLFTAGTLTFGLVYTVGALLAKYLGCGIPALFLNFNLTGAKRIGYGMIPRGEVALIIAGIGLSYGFLADPKYNIFGISVLMTLVTTLIAPPLLNHELKSSKSGMRKPTNMPEKENLQYYFDDKELTDLMAHKVLLQFQSLGFFVNKVDPDIAHYQIRRDATNITMTQLPHELSLQTEVENSLFVKRMVFEASFYLKQAVTGILSMDGFHEPGAEIETVEEHNSIANTLTSADIIPSLKSETREGIVWELLQKLTDNGKLKEMKKVYYSVMEREKYLSGGLVHGLAIPHAHTDYVDKPLIAIGIKREGVDFDSIDKKPSYLVVLILTPERETNVHIKWLSQISKLGRSASTLISLVKLDTAEEIYKEIKHITEVEVV